MTELISEKRTLKRPAEEVFDFLSDLNNLELLMPDRVVDWSSDSQSCKFTIQGTATLGLKIKELNRPDKITLTGTDAPFAFDLFIEMVEFEGRTETCFRLMANMNAMLEMMAKRPLTSFLNMLNDKLAVTDLDQGK